MSFSGAHMMKYWLDCCLGFGMYSPFNCPKLNFINLNIILNYKNVILYTLLEIFFFNLNQNIYSSCHLKSKET